MNRTIVAAHDLDLETPGRRDYHVQLEHTSIWAHHLVPVTVLVGPRAQPGRGLLAIGATHGDELEGPVALKHLLRELRADDVTGRVVLVPLLNVMAFGAGRRDSPDDGVNLNRAFPGSATGTVTYRLADMVARRLFPHVHVVLDLHAGGEVARFPPLASLHAVPDRDRLRDMQETARGFGTRFVLLYQSLTPGLLTSCAEDRGKIAIGGELGWGRALQVGGVAMARQGVLNAAIRHGQLAGAPVGGGVPAAEQLLVDSSDPACSLLAPTSGHFEPAVELGARVARGDRVAWLHDFERIDAAPVALIAPHDGYVVCQAWGARVIQGQIVTQVAPPVAWA